MSGEFDKPQPTESDKPKKRGFDPKAALEEQLAQRSEQTPQHRRMYVEAVAIIHRRIEEVEAEITTGKYADTHRARAREHSHKHGEPISESYNHMVSFGESEQKNTSPRYNLGIASVGNDQLELYKAYLPYNNNDQEINKLQQDENSYLIVSMYLYSDGSPYIADGDDLESEFGNGYQLILAPEMEPRLIQSKDDGRPYTEQLSMYPTYKLTDDECEKMLQLLATAPVFVEHVE